MTYENRCFSLKEIATWLQSDNEVQLPAFQRGFVWKVSQIECLWDSIFRGYPIGAMMLSEVGGKMDLLDGQQRAISIALGFYDPWTKAIEKLGNAINLPVVWIDVCPKPETKVNGYKYSFRVVTRSHPWGYSQHNNSSILNVKARRSANEMYKKIFGQEYYTKLEPTQRLPFDAYCPIPLSFLLDAAMNDNSGKEIVEKCKKNIPRDYRTLRMSTNEDYFSILDSIDLSGLIEVVRKNVLPMMIPSIVIDPELLVGDDVSDFDESTIFLRLNIQGTKIEGEELMYSMFKAVCPETKDLVEQIGLKFVPPSRIITLASRLILSELREDKGYVEKITLDQFKKEVQNQNFLENMKELIGNINSSPIKDMIESAIGVLQYNNIPNIVVKEFLKNSPDGFLLLLHWIKNNEVRNISEITKQIIASRLYRNLWFGQDFVYTIKKIWTHVAEPDFWSDKYFINEGWIRQYPVVCPDLLKKFFFDRVNNPQEDYRITPNDGILWETWTESLCRPEDITDEEYENRINKGWFDFIYNNLFKNKTLILVAQREYINETFKEYCEFDVLEDTSRPYDWDHIFPQNFVKGRWYMDSRTKSWEERIGNLRAMPLSDNRSEHDSMSPAERFNTPQAKKDYFVKENDLKFWEELDANHKRILEGDTDNILRHAKAIITRMRNIYEEVLVTLGLWDRS